jgi:hypothetical protein
MAFDSDGVMVAVGTATELDVFLPLPRTMGSEGIIMTGWLLYIGYIVILMFCSLYLHKYGGGLAIVHELRPLLL